MYLSNWLTLGDDTCEDKEIRCEIFLRRENKSTTSQHLSCVIDNDKVFLIYTTGRQLTPSCSGCHSPNCHHIRIWRKKLDEGKSQEKEVVNNDTDSDNRPPAHYLDREIQYGHKMYLGLAAPGT